MQQRKDRIRVHLAGKEFNVEGGTFQEMLAAVKQIKGRRFVSQLKVWQLPGSEAEVRQHIENSGFRLAGGTPLSPGQAVAAYNDRIRVEIEGRPMSVVGGQFQEMLAVVKNLPDRRFDSEAKVWQIRGDVGVIKGMIQTAGFTLEGAENIPVADVPPMEPLDFDDLPEPPPYEPPDFFDDAPSPPPPPPGWFEEEMPADLDVPDAPLPFDDDFPPPPSRPAPAPATSGGDRIRIQVGEQMMVVTGGTFQAMLAAVKQLPDRRFDGNSKTWQIPAEVGVDQVQHMLQAAGFTLAVDG